MTRESIAALAALAATQTDHTKAPESNNTEREVAAPGKGLMRLREYIEIGKHANATAAFPDKAPSQKARFVFELVTPKHIKNVPQEGKEDLVISHVLGVTLAMPDFGKAAHPKSAYHKLFSKLNYDGKLTHPAQALGRGYIVNIVAGYDKDDLVNGQPKEGAKPKYANFKDSDGGFMIEPPRMEDPMSGVVTELKVPELLNEMKIFLYNNPTQPTWDSLKIEGTYKDKDDKEVSKNWLQETIMKALDFQGSKTHIMLQSGSADTLDNLPSGATKEAVKEAPVIPAAVTEAAVLVDPLAGFGL